MSQRAHPLSALSRAIGIRPEKGDSTLEVIWMIAVICLAVLIVGSLAMSEAESPLREGEGQERKLHPTCQFCGKVLEHLLICAAEWPHPRGTWCCEDCAGSGRLPAEPTNPRPPVEAETWVEGSDCHPCSCCGKSTGILLESFAGAEGYLCDSCVGSPEAEAKGFTHN